MVISVFMVCYHWVRKSNWFWIILLSCFISFALIILCRTLLDSIITVINSTNEWLVCILNIIDKSVERFENSMTFLFQVREFDEKSHQHLLKTSIVVFWSSIVWFMLVLTRAILRRNLSIKWFPIEYFPLDSVKLCRGEQWSCYRIMFCKWNLCFSKSIHKCDACAK